VDLVIKALVRHPSSASSSLQVFAEFSFFFSTVAPIHSISYLSHVTIKLHNNVLKLLLEFRKLHLIIHKLLLDVCKLLLGFHELPDDCCSSVAAAV
jgi:hypothetical protein